MLKWKSALQHLWSFTHLVNHNVRHCQQHMRSFGAVDVVRTRLLGTGGGEFDSWGWPWPEHRVQTVPVKLRTWIHIWQKTVLESTSHPKISKHILPTVLFTFPVIDKENLFHDPKLLRLVIISFILAILTLYILTSVCTFSILFSIHFLRCWQGEFV